MPTAPPKSSSGPRTLSQVLMAVHAELRQVLDPSVANDADATHTTLNALTEEDWNMVLYPVSELRPYLQVSSRGLAQSSPPDSATTDTTSTPHPTTPHATTTELYNETVLTHYVKCRCAELPMRLQTEAVLLRRHEYVVRQRMRELIELSEYIALCGGQAPELRPEKGSIPTSAMASSTGDEALPSDVQMLLSPSDAARRLQRAQERIAELEKLVRQESWQRLRCSQRMVLMSKVTRALMRQWRESLSTAPGDVRDNNEAISRPAKKQRSE